MKRPVHVALLVAGLSSACVEASTQGHATTGGQASSGTTGTDDSLLGLGVDPTALDFGDTPIGTTATKSVTIRSASNAPLNGITVVVGGMDASLFKVVDAPTSLAANSAATVDISYSPTVLETRSAADVTFLANGGGKTVDLYGEPVGVAWTLVPNPINFGYVPIAGTSIGCTTVTNQSAVELSITAVTNFSTCGGAFALATTDDATPPNPFSLPITIPGGASAKVCFSFTQPIVGECQGQVTLVTNDPRGFNPVLQFSAWSGGPAHECVPLTLAFGETLDHSVSTIPVICQNVGTAIPGVNLTIEPPTASPDVFSAEFDQTKNPYPVGGLAPGQSAQIDVNYAPTTASNDKGTLTIKSNAGPPLEISLTGQGLDIPPCQFVLAPSSVDFANVVLGDPPTILTFELQNIGATICLIPGPSITNDPTGAFSIVSLSIPPDPITGRVAIPPPGMGVVSSLTFEVEFAPTTIGAISADLNIAGQTSELSATCESACLTVSPTSIDFGAAGLHDAGAARTFAVSTQCPGKTSLKSITLQSGPGDSEAQFSLLPGPTLPAVISEGSSLSFQVSCTPTTPGTHVAQLLVSDGTLDTLVALSCSAP